MYRRIRNYAYFLVIYLPFLSCEKQEQAASGPEANPSAQQVQGESGAIEGRSRQSIEDQIAEFPSDSSKLAYLNKLSTYFYTNKQWEQFKYWNQKELRAAKEMKDSCAWAESLRVLANYYYRINKYDSSYYHYNQSLEHYERLEDDYNSAKVLINMATIERNSKDFIGSEVTTMRAIRLLKPLDENYLLYLSYNNLGILYNELGEPDEALKYHEEALDYQKKLQEEVLKVSSLNNIGVVYSNRNDYHKAKETFQRALRHKGTYAENPRLYAMLLDNLAYAEFKTDESAPVLPKFREALRIRQEIDHRSGITVNKLHLAEYYLQQGDSIQALAYLREAKELSEASNNFRDYLKSLLMLSKVDGENSENYLRYYIKVSDSLQREERIIRNKFARIRFETDEFIAMTTNLAQEKKLIFIGSTAMFGILLLLFSNNYQRNKNKQLKLERANQISNEEVYNLLLIQQNKLEEGRNKEKNRISQELHDGILGKLFGVRLMLESFLQDPGDDIKEVQSKYLNDLRLIEEEVRNIAHDLKSDDLAKETNFVRVLEEYLEEQERVGDFVVDLEYNQNMKWERLPNGHKVNIFRIIQEALRNTQKYASATQVTISFRKIKNTLKVQIRDNGIGFREGKRSSGIGIMNMKSRAKVMKGDLEITSNSSGTEVNLKVPI